MATTTNLGTRTVGLQDTFEFHICGLCGVTWGMPLSFLEKRRADGKDWHCPNGHTWHWTPGPTKEQKLERDLKWERDRAARLAADLDQTKASLRGTKGVVTKLKKRAAGGACPCCNRTFTNLQRHMATKHPDFADEAATETLRGTCKTPGCPNDHEATRGRYARLCRSCRAEKAAGS